MKDLMIQAATTNLQPGIEKLASNIQ